MGCCGRDDDQNKQVQKSPAKQTELHMMHIQLGNLK